MMNCHPLVKGMDRLTQISPYFRLPVKGSEADGWVSAYDLFHEDNDRLKNMVRDYGLEHWDSSNPHVSGSAFLIAYLTRLVWPVIGQFVLERRVPDVTLKNLAFHVKGGSDRRFIDGTAMVIPYFAALKDDTDIQHEHAIEAIDYANLFTVLKRMLFQENLSPVIDSLTQICRASMPVSKNAVASACAQAFRHLYPFVDNPGDLAQLAKELFDDESTVVFGQVTMEVIKMETRSGLFARRLGCCLAWRTSRLNGYCSNCILVSKSEQDKAFELIEDGAWRDVIK